MAKYTPSALKAVIETGSNREAAARQAVEAAGNKLIGFYGMFGQEYNIVMIVEAAGHSQYIGGISPVLGSGVFECYKTIPLYTAADVVNSAPIALASHGITDLDRYAVVPGTHDLKGELFLD